MSDQTQQDRSPEAVAARLGAPVAPAAPVPVAGGELGLSASVTIQYEISE